MKSLETQSQDDLENMAKKARVVRMEPKAETQEYTLTKKATAAMARELVGIQNVFSKILSNTKNVKALQEVQSKSDMSGAQSIAYVPVPAEIIGGDTFGGSMKLLGDYFEHLAKQLKKLDLSPSAPEEEGDDDGASVDAGSKKKKKKARGKGKSKGKGKGKLRGRGLAGKALGIFAIGMDLADRLGGGESIVEAGVGVAGGAAGGWAGAEAGALLGAAVGGPAAPITGAIGGLVGGALGYLGGGYVADKAYKAATQESPAEKKLESVTAKTAAVAAYQEPTEISNNSYSSRFASYLSETFFNVNTYVSALQDSGGSNDINDFSRYSGQGSGMTVNAQIAMDFFTSPEGGGWTKEQAAGIIANLQAESELNPNSFNERGGGKGAVGIAQWRGARQTKFQELYKKPIRGSSLTEQLAYVNWELNSGSSLEKKAGTELRKAKTAQEAATTFYRLFERPSEDDRSGGKRIANAVALMTAPPPLPDASQLTGGQLLNPVPSGRLTSLFGDPRPGHTHKGIDLAAPIGTPIMAAAAGKAVLVGVSGAAGGNRVRIDHGNGLWTSYEHMSSFAVRQGQDVAAGQIIGTVGNTGIGTGPHVHFTVWKDGTETNPLPYITGAKPEKSIFNNFQPADFNYYNDLKAPKKKKNNNLDILGLIGSSGSQKPDVSLSSQFRSGTVRPRKQNPSGKDKILSYYN